MCLEQARHRVRTSRVVAGEEGGAVGATANGEGVPLREAEPGLKSNGGHSCATL